MPLIFPSTVPRSAQPSMKSFLTCSATSSGKSLRLAASVRIRPGCGKSMTSGGLPPWSSTGAWTSNWSVPWKSILTPVQSASGFQKSVKIWMALGSFSLLRTGESRTDRLAGVLLVALDLAAEQAVARRSAAGAAPASTHRKARRCAAVPAVVPRGVGSPAATTGGERQGRDGRDCRDTRSVSHKLPLVRSTRRTRWLRPVPAGATQRQRLLALPLEMMWNRMEDSEGYHSSRHPRGEDVVGNN